MMNVIGLVLIFFFYMSRFCYANVFSYCQPLMWSEGGIRFGYTGVFYDLSRLKPSPEAMEYALIKNLNLRVGVYRSEPLKANSMMSNGKNVQSLLLQINKNADVTLILETETSDSETVEIRYNGILNNYTMFFAVSDLMDEGLMFYYAIQDCTIYALLNPHGRQMPLRFVKVKDLDKAEFLPKNKQSKEYDRLILKSPACRKILNKKWEEISRWYRCTSKYLLNALNVDEYYLAFDKERKNNALIEYADGYYWGGIDASLFVGAIYRNLHHWGAFSISKDCLSFCRRPPPLLDGATFFLDMVKFDMAHHANSSSNLEEYQKKYEYLVSRETAAKNEMIENFWRKNAPLELKTIFEKCERPNITTNNLKVFGAEWIPMEQPFFGPHPLSGPTADGNEIKCLLFEN